MSNAVLRFDRVSKRFGDVAAVEDLSFAVPAGGIFGFLGGNGAGKTTSLRMALDILAPSSGQIEILGESPSRDHSAQIGFLPEERGLYRRMSVIDVITYFGRLKRMNEKSARASGMALLERLELADRAKTRIEKLSKGLAQKVQVATALVNSPSLLLLDEPFSGLDPVNQGVLEKLICEAASGGATVIFSTHIMQHAERLCDRLLLLAKGRKVFEGTQDQARQTLPGRLCLTSRADPAQLPGIARATPQAAADNGWTRYSVELEPATAPESVLEHCTGSGFALRSFDVETPTLHEVFVHLVGSGAEAGQ